MTTDTGLGLTEEHAALADSVRRWAERTNPRRETREVFEAHPEARPASFDDAAKQGWLGLHVPEEHGGAGAGLVEVAVVLAEMGRAMVPGPVLPTVLTSALLLRADAPLAHKALVPGLADGSLAGAVALTRGDLRLVEGDDGLRLSGDAGLVLGAGSADVLLAGVQSVDGECWLAVDMTTAALRTVANLDGSRRVARVSFDDVPVGDDRLLPGLDRRLVRDLAATLASAEAAGIAAWCLDAATEYAKVREQFGRRIGQFQAIKHTCATMLVRVEMARAAAWDAARAFDDADERAIATATAAATALDGAVDCAKDCVQVHGGIGYTWEHDAHLYLKRATVLRQIMGPTGPWRQRLARRAVAGGRRHLIVELPPQAQELRTEIAAFADEMGTLTSGAQRRRMIEDGYLVPHWPQPYGRNADPIEQLVIAEELARIGYKQPPMVNGMGDWVLPTLIQFGNDEQRERFILPTMRGEVVWCQLFSEPGAGSDLASLQTRAERVDGGWVLNGQKVWNSFAQWASWGICLARTNPTAAKHEGITYFLVEMSFPGIEVRPLREMTGHSLFNEVFLNDVFVPDDQVVGEVDKGWPLARNTLANERVSMSSEVFESVEPLLELCASRELDDGALERLGELVREGQALALLGHRTTLRQVSGTDPGPAVSVRKLMMALHQQAVAEYALDLLGAEGATFEDEAGTWGFLYLSSRSMTLVGGTTEVQRNLIGERILGLPRDEGR